MYTLIVSHTVVDSEKWSQSNRTITKTKHSLNMLQVVAFHYSKVIRIGELKKTLTGTFRAENWKQYLGICSSVHQKAIRVALIKNE